MTVREREMLIALSDTEFRAPLLLGAWNGSHHSQTLTRMAAKGLVERKKFHATYCYFGTMHEGKRVKRCCCKGHCEYRRTKAGSAAMLAARRAAEATR